MAVMIEKRRDKKGRVLRSGECQRKNGLYQYDYVDLNGKAKCLYSWKLEPGDPLPQGKRKCKSLREKEREIQRNIDDGIVPYGGQLTVLALTKKYILQKKGVRESTRPAFQMAVDDDLLRKNPFQFELVSVIVNDSVTRDAITHDEKRKFLEFIRNDKHFCKYYDGIYILFYTGMRISEFVGLTIKDIDLKEKTINIDHQLQRTSQMQYIIEPPKTEAGIRVIPMQEEVCECFRRIIQNRRKPKVEPMVGGKVGFLYLDKNEMPMVALHWEKYFQHIVEKYNKIYKVQMPKITPHVCRHTYCSHCASSGMNPKHLQYLMGHSDISVTLNTYTHVDFDNVKKEVQSLEKAVL